MLNSFFGEKGRPKSYQLPERRHLPNSTVAATGRSVLFLHLSYYHFFYLAKALRARGWDAVSLALESPSSPSWQFTHGADHNIWFDDPNLRTEKLNDLVLEIAERFRWLQFSGDGMMAFLPHMQDTDERRARIPEEFVALRAAGLRIGYTVVGCTDGNSQTTWNRWTHGNCNKCTLQHKPGVCSDFRNLAWAHKRDMFCDLIAGEMIPRLDYNTGPKVYSNPLTMSLDETVFDPDIAIPEHCLLPREPGEVLILHAVGNYNSESYIGIRNYKGTPAIKDAIKQLRSENLKVRLVFLTNIPSSEMRFYQAQADIVVDQLNFGRYGAFARESLMLGKPVIGWLKKQEDVGPVLDSVAEAPIVNATEETIADVLRELVTDRARREEVGRRSRAFALKWHSATAQAERFEQMYDHVMAGGAPAEFVWHPSRQIMALVADEETA